MKTTRRSFVKQTALFTAAVPMILSENLFAKQDQLGIALVGAGIRSGALSVGFGIDKRTKILYVTDPDISRANSLCNRIEKQFGYRPKALVDFRKALEDRAVDALACASCNHWHALTAIWTLQAGRHCYMEKPLSFSLFEGKAITAAAEKSGLVFQTGTQRRSTTNVNELVDFIHQGGIGEVKLARVCGYRRRDAIGPLGHYPLPNGVDYDFWSGPAPVRPLTRPVFHYDWHWQRLYGNGDLGNQCPHRLDIARWALGLNTVPNSVFTYGGRLGYDVQMKDPDYVDAGDTANTSITIYNYKTKTIVCEVRGLKSPPLFLPVGDKVGAQIGIIFYGSEGYGIQAPYGRGNIYSVCFAYDLKGNVIKEFRSVDAQGRLTPDQNATDRHVSNFVDAIIANDPKKVNADARCGELSAALAHYGNISWYLGEKDKISPVELKKVLENVPSFDNNEETLVRTVQHLERNGVDLNRTPLSLGAQLNIDTEKEVFIGNDQANALMSREYRKSFEVKAI
ncbi:MAG: Gfo/Idh/MocA family oxidoreductase [Planctomycetia bacterium]|nr:Gfo/Idh/MocA family oxidoreductase [Planctomycetia bacterium]